MIMGQAFARMKFGILALMAAVFTVAGAPAMAQAAAEAEPAVAEAVAADGSEVLADAEAASGAYTPLKPVAGKGQPTAFEDDALASMTFQQQYTEDGRFALALHNYGLLPLIFAICIFVLALLVIVMVRFNKRANPEPSKTTHNTLIEVVWTVIPALLLVFVAVPSLTLIARQYETPPENAVTIKAVGYQWYWGYEYPDHGVELVSNMSDREAAVAAGEPFQLAVDNRMVVPVGVPLRIQTTAADVIHSFAVPSLWFKQDAVPGRLTQRLLVIDEPGVYYGQCSELCGALHGFMPIAVEAVPMEQFEAWVAMNGGTMPAAEQAADEAEVTEEVEAAEANPEAGDAAAAVEDAASEEAPAE